MQESYLSNGSDDDDSQNGKIQMAVPEKKMYGIQFEFMTIFKKKIQQIQAGIQQVLMALTNCEEGQKKRLPYSVLRSFQKSLKQLRKLKQTTIEENKKYSQELANRQKQKVAKNALFKQYLVQLNDKKQQLKLYISKVETKVRSLQDTGYAQFIQFDVVVPEMDTIRFSYDCKALIILFLTRNQNSDNVKEELRRRKRILRMLNQQKIAKTIKQGQNLQDSNLKQETCREQINKDNNTNNLCLLTNQSLKLTEALNYFKTFKYFVNERILIHELIKIRVQKSKLQSQVQKLKHGLKLSQQQIYKRKLRNGMLSEQKNLTKTDGLIYLKQMQAEIKQQLDTRIFRLDQKIHRLRSKSFSSGNHRI